MDTKLQELVRRDRRYPVEAYEFVSDAVSFTQELLGRSPEEQRDPDADYHVGGIDLARGTCRLAVEEFGLMASVVFKLWNIHRSDDIGNIVFNLIKVKELSASEDDDIEDFHDLFEIEKELTEGFELTMVEVARSPRKAER